jgi:hypothetical protein
MTFLYHVCKKKTAIQIKCDLNRKVTLMEDEDNNIHLRNLSMHPANNEEEALNLLFLGDTNRMIAEVKFLIFTIERLHFI